MCSKSCQNLKLRHGSYGQHDGKIKVPGSHTVAFFVEDNRIQLAIAFLLFRLGNDCPRLYAREIKCIFVLVDFWSPFAAGLQVRPAQNNLALGRTLRYPRQDSARLSFPTGVPEAFVAHAAETTACGKQGCTRVCPPAFFCNLEALAFSRIQALSTLMLRRRCSPCLGPYERPPTLHQPPALTT